MALVHILMCIFASHFIGVLMPAINIPRLDLLDFIGKDLDKQDAFSQELGKAFNDTGFVMIANHGLNQQLIEELYEHIQLYFDLPESVKRAYEIPELFGQRGYTGKGREKAKDALTPDLKEFWQCGFYCFTSCLIKHNNANKVLPSIVYLLLHH